MVGRLLLALVLVVAAWCSAGRTAWSTKVGKHRAGVTRAQGDLKQLPTNDQPAVALVIGSDFRASDGGRQLAARTR